MKFSLWSAVCLLFVLMISCKKDTNETPVSTVTDVDGNVYHIVTIGTQQWPVEHLRTTKFNDATEIPNIPDDHNWANLTTAWIVMNEFEAYSDPRGIRSDFQGSEDEQCSGVFMDPRTSYSGYLMIRIGKQCWLKENVELKSGNSWLYDNDITKLSRFGLLYDWETAMTICPPGWHLPSDAEWDELAEYLGGASMAGAAMREPWTSDDNATNSSGISAEPGGFRAIDGGFHYLGDGGNWGQAQVTMEHTPKTGTSIKISPGWAAVPRIKGSVRALGV